MVESQEYKSSFGGDATLFTFALLTIVFVIAAVASFDILFPKLGMKEVGIPPFHMTVNSSGDVEVPLPVDGSGLPSVPDCRDLDPKACSWESKLIQKVTGEDRVIETVLKKEGEIIGKAEVGEIETAAYKELEGLSSAGYDKAWISAIRVAKSYRGNGLGRTMWKASDAMIRTLAGPGAVHLFVDNAGWGKAIMRDVPVGNIIAIGDGWWAYLIP